MIRRIYQETALEEVEKDEGDSREEPVPRLRDCLMSSVAEHPVTRLSLVAFAVGTTFLALMTYLPLAPHAPTTCAIAVGPIVLLAGIAVFVAVGVKATEGNPLLEDGDTCPRGLTEALKGEFKYVILALAPSLVYVYVLVFALWMIEGPYFVYRMGPPCICASDDTVSIPPEVWPAPADLCLPSSFSAEVAHSSKNCDRTCALSESGPGRNTQP